jgi:hypothetical protein
LARDNVGDESIFVIEAILDHGGDWLDFKVGIAFFMAFWMVLLTQSRWWRLAVMLLMKPAFTTS